MIYIIMPNYESLFTIFPELVQVEKIGGKCVSFGNSSSISLQLCKDIWESTKNQIEPNYSDKHMEVS